MAQFKIYGFAAALLPLRQEISDVLHRTSVAVLGLPEDKRFHRFFPLEPESFIVPARSDRYTIIEVVLFEGRTVETKKSFYREVFESFDRDLGISPRDVEMTFFDTPRHDWGIRGLPGDELTSVDPTPAKESS